MMPSRPPRLRRSAFRFALPPSLGTDAAAGRAGRLQEALSKQMERPVEVAVMSSYAELAREVLGGASDAAWGPPYVCARLEAMGVRAVARGIRKGSSGYRAALVARAEAGLTLETLSGKAAVWVDKESAGGHLLALSLLRARGLDPAKLFFSQSFAGSYRAALEQLLSGRADVTSVFANSTEEGSAVLGAEEILPGTAAQLAVLAWSEEIPNDGVLVAPEADPGAAFALEQSLLTMELEDDGPEVLQDVFSVERFESAPPLGYRALYRVAMASL
jgi:phosphonate transport system substrate-binding protein